MARLLPYLAVTVVAGAIGALIAVTLASPPERAAEDVSGQLSELRADLRRMDAELRSVRGTLEDRGVAPLDAPATIAGNGPRATDSPTAAEEAPAAEETTDSPAEDDRIRETVKEAVAEEQKRRQEAMGQRFAAMAASREKTMLDRLTESHGITPYQREEMEKILARRREAIGNMFRSFFGAGQGEGEAQSPPDFSKMREIQTAADEEIKTVLSPSQYEAYQKEQESSRGGPPWMGGGRRTDGR